MLLLRVSESVLHFKVSFLPVTVMWNWCQRNIMFGQLNKFSFSCPSPARRAPLRAAICVQVQARLIRPALKMSQELPE